MNPLENERFSRLFHITKNLFDLVRKMDVDGKHSGYIRQNRELIDELFIEQAKQEK